MAQVHEADDGSVRIPIERVKHLRRNDAALLELSATGNESELKALLNVTAVLLMSTHKTHRSSQHCTTPATKATPLSSSFSWALERRHT
jgi:hypothetical protein